MDFGIALAASPENWSTIQRAEELGFRSAWVYDSQLLCADPFIVMALAAEHTSRIRIGTGVLIPSNRLAPVAANCFATLNHLAPGRIDFGVGTGFTGRNTMGLSAQTLREMRTYIDVVEGLLKGEMVEFETEGMTRKIRFLNPDAGMIDIKSRVPLHISAFGPKGRALTARRADGWITFISHVPGAAEQASAMDEACRAAGRDVATLYKTAFTLGCVLAEGEAADSPRAMAQAGPMAAVALHGLMERSDVTGAVVGLSGPMLELANAYRQLYESYEPADARYATLHRGHLVFVRDDERPFITGDLIRALTFTATAGELRDRVRAVGAAGYQQFTVQLVHGQEDAIEEWAKLLETV
ncbi:MAG: LLM class flavin-dependent oxidoreductase [Chloroflexi bacterium]|nr:LLM class flavin-dependent oxidoreductase [Chloroflexota bacterium]